MDDRYLRIYLNDHLAGSTVGLELARRAASSNEGTELGSFLAGLADQIESEREELKEMIGHVGGSPDRVKMHLAWAGEKLGRLKPNGQIRGYSPLSRVVELEGLTLGVTGKLLLWRSLRENRADLRGFGLDDLIANAEEQRDRLEQHRIEATRLAFARG